MASISRSLGAGVAIGIGWFLANVLLRGASMESALTGQGIAVSGAVVAFLVGALATFLFQ